MTFATILLFIVQCKHTSRENALARNFKQVSNETNKEACEKVPSVPQTMSEKTNCVINTYRWTLVRETGPEGADQVGFATA